MTDKPYKWYDWQSAVGTGRGLAGRGGSEYDIFS
jgi:hypothetical protein